MNLRDLLDFVVSGSRDDWCRVIGGSPPGGVAGYVVSGPVGEDLSITEVREHHQHAVHQQRPEIAIAYGLPLERDLSFPSFEERFAARGIHSFAADVLLNGAVIHRSVLLSVDGGSGYLPMPFAMLSNDFGGVAEVEIVAEQVTSWDVRFARLIENVAHSETRDFDRYLRQSGFVEVDGHPADRP